MIAESDLRTPTDQTTTPNPTENVDRIRDIIFGSRMREYAQRFQQIEEQLARESADLKGEFGRRLESVEARNRQETDSLTDRLNTERTERAESTERISRELNDSVRLLDRRLRQFDEQMAKDLRELRQLTLDHHKSLSNELTQALAAQVALEGRRSDELRASAVNRFDLADLLAELALRLRGEFHAPGEGNSVNGGEDKRGA
jgi:hypothetical protein